MGLITHLRSVAVSAKDPSSLLPFYQQTWGLEQVGTGTDGRIMLRAGGPEHHVFALVPGDGHSLVQISLGAATPAAVDELTGRVRAAGMPVAKEPGPIEGPGGGYGAVVQDPEGRRIEISADVLSHTAPPERPFGPDRLSHVVLNSTDLAAAQDFYTQVLGFKISDWYEDDQMIFLRCNEMHHCVVLAPGKWVSLNHVAFEVASGDEVMRSLGRMRKAGFDTVWGPGRHGPGGNVFCYFIDPMGNVIEYTAELLTIDDTWTPQVWERNQENADVWGTSGGINPQILEAMSNPPASERAH